LWGWIGSNNGNGQELQSEKVPFPEGINPTWCREQKFFVVRATKGASMYRKFICAAVVSVVVASVAMCDEFFAVITKVEGEKVTVQKMKKAKKGQPAEKEGDPITLTIAKDAKITKGKFDKDSKKFVAGDAIEEGLKSKMFADITAEKGVNAMITTDDGGKSITAITTVGGKKKKKDAN